MILYAVTIFVSAFLLFQLQPVIAKIILPWFGGTAAVWTTCMLFFQSALLLGYGYSHVTQRLPAKQQTRLHSILLLGSLLFLPVLPAESWKPAGDENPTWRILALLAATVGLPYLLLSTTGPLIQAWFARAFPARSPYRLYALSNIGSMLALLGYPIFVEPLLATRRQAWVWSAGYVIFALLSLATAWHSRDLKEAAGRLDPEPAQAPSGGLWLLWTALAACPSILLLSVTNHLTQDVAPIPFLWVLPLSIYLLSFILTFDGSGWYHRKLYLPMTGAGLGAMVYGLSTSSQTGVFAKIAIFGAALFLCCMTCHGEVAALKPHPRSLTAFYLMISLGGALGGIFVGIVAPIVFPLYLEMPIGIVLCAMLMLVTQYRDPESLLHRTQNGWGWVVAGAATVAIAFSLYQNLRTTSQEYRVLARNFYGGLRTADWGSAEERDYTRKLTHGVINHGQQYLQPDRRREATSYFGPTTGVSRAILNKDRERPQRIGITGLGAGVMLTYARPGDYYRVYEINPLVIDVAKREFTFIQDCRAKLEIVLGDARLSLERESPQNFDVLHLDAFSSDSVPVHLLTREAFEVYFRHLKPDGVLVIHISNRYLNLEPVVARAVEALGKHAVLVIDPGDDDTGFFGTDMVLVTSEPKFFDRLSMKGFPPPKTEPKVLLWTDDYSNLYRIVK